MTAVTLAYIRHNTDGSVERGTITVDPDDPNNPKARVRPPSGPSLQDQITNLTNALVEQGALPLQAAQGLGIASVTGIIAAPLV